MEIYRGIKEMFNISLDLPHRTKHHGDTDLTKTVSTATARMEMVNTHVFTPGRKSARVIVDPYDAGQAVLQTSERGGAAVEADDAEVVEVTEEDVVIELDG